jgi:hypothetical protein
LQKPENTANLLKRETLASQFRDKRNFQDFLGQINPFVPFVARGNDFALVPPLELP